RLRSKNLARIKLLAFVLHVLCVVQAVSLHKIASAMVCIALAWAYLVGEHKDMNVKAIRILKHGKRAKSPVKYGLEEIANVLFRPLYNPKFNVFKFLSCT
ncbi:MAG: hypothetical protein ACI30O_09015, partial [Muribaculaceae bacterium]